MSIITNVLPLPPLPKNICFISHPITALHLKKIFTNRCQRAIDAFSDLNNTPPKSKDIEKAAEAIEAALSLRSKAEVIKYIRKNCTSKNQLDFLTSSTNLLELWKDVKRFYPALTINELILTMNQLLQKLK